MIRNTRAFSRRMFLSGWLLMPLLVLGCRLERRERSASPQSTATTIVTDTASPWTREGLEVQPQMTLLQQRTPAALELKPATTAWRPVERTAQHTVPDSSRYTAPGAFLSALILSLGWSAALGDAAWEQTTRIWFEDEDSALGVVLQWGLMDDAVAGRDLRVHLRRVNGIWRAEQLEERFHCRRAVSADGVCT